MKAEQHSDTMQLEQQKALQAFDVYPLDAIVVCRFYGCTVYFHFSEVFDFSLHVCFGLNPPTSGRGLVSWIADHVRESPHQNPGWLGYVGDYTT